MHSHSDSIAPRGTSLAHRNLTCLTSARILEIGFEARKVVPVRARGTDGELGDIEARGREVPVLTLLATVRASMVTGPVGTERSFYDEINVIL